MVTTGLVFYIDEHEHPEAIKYIDPCISLLSILIIVLTSWPLSHKLATILLQNSPVDVQKLKQEILFTFPQIFSVHEFHTWSLMHGQIVANLHVTYQSFEVSGISSEITKFTFLKPQFSQNSHFWNLNFHKIHISEISKSREFLNKKWVLPKCAEVDFPSVIFCSSTTKKCLENHKISTPLVPFYSTGSKAFVYTNKQGSSEAVR